MARVVCQALARPHRLTLIWSEGSATFPPYHLEGAALAELRRLASEGHQQLAKLGSGADDPAASASAAFQLAQTGHALYRLLFQLDYPGDAPGHEVRTWLDGLTRDSAVERLEIIGDAFTLPWNAVYNFGPEQAAFTSSGHDTGPWRGFWGHAYNLLGGNRVQWLRGRQLPEKPTLVLAIDPALRASLPQEEQQRLNAFLDGRGAVMAESAATLTTIFQSQEVDLLYLFARAEGDGLRLGEDHLGHTQLETIVFGDRDEEGPSGQTVVFLNACGSSTVGNILANFERFSGIGLIGTSHPLAAPLANRCGLELLTNFLEGSQTLAKALADFRQRQPIPGLVYFACCPGDVRPSTQTEDFSDLEPHPLPDQPYQPLAPLYEDSAALLAGRDYDAASIASLLDEAATRLVLIHGSPGVGKTSLIHAGVVPYLEERCIGYRVLRQRGEVELGAEERDFPVLSIRATSDLAGQITLALLEFCGRPYSYVTPTGRTVTVDLPAILCRATGITGDPLPPADDLRIALRRQPELFGQLLAAIAAPLPFELLLVIEHGEELFSLMLSQRKPREAQRALALLRGVLGTDARAKVLVLLRTEYVGRFLEPLSTFDAGRSVRTFQVNELSEEELVQVILQPTSEEPLPGTEEIPHEQYRFLYEQGLAERIASEAKRFGTENQESPLALVHVIAGQLYWRTRNRAEPIARAADLKAIGGVDKGLAKYVARLVKTTAAGKDRKALWDLLRKLLVPQPDGSLTSDLVPEDKLETDWRGNAPLHEVVATAAGDSARLLERHYLYVGGKEGDFVSLGCDALAPAVAHQADETAKRSYGWSRFTDALWITIPIMILVSVVAWRYISAQSNSLEEADKQNKLSAELLKEVELERERFHAMHWPTYVGQVRAAEQSILAGDLVRARQALLSLKPIGKESDYRGFDWHYVWQQMHLDHATLLGHRDTISATALTSDGALLATTSGDGTVRVWDAAGRELSKLDLRDKNTLAPGRCVAFSPDGTFLAAGADDGVIRLWKVQRSAFNLPLNAAALIGALLPHTGIVVSPLIQVQVALPGTPGDAVVRHAELSDHQGAVLALAFAANGKTLASAGKDGTIKLWDVAQPQPKVEKSLKEHDGAVLALAYSPDGKWLASGGADKKTVIWDADKRTKKATLEGHPKEVVALAWTPDGKTLATAGAQTVNLLEVGQVKLWNTANWKERPAVPFAVAPVFAVSFANAGKTLVTASKNNNVQLWNVADGKEQTALRGHLSWVRSLAVARDGDIIASGSYDGTAKLWRPRDMASRDLLKVSSDPVCSVSFSPDDQWLATGSADGSIKLWKTTGADDAKVLKSHSGAVMALAWAHGGKWLISGGADKQLKLWDMDTASKTYATEVHSVPAAHDKDVTCLQWLPKNLRFASGSLDGSVKRWKVEDRKLVQETMTTTSESAVLCLVLSDDLELLVTGHEDGNVRLWDLLKGKPYGHVKKTVLSGHTERVTGMALMLLKRTDGAVIRLITCSADQSIKYWDLGSGKDHPTMRSHNGPVTCIALGPEPELSLATGGIDQTVKLWDPEVHKERMTFSPGISAIHAIAVSHNGRLIAAAGQDGHVRLYRAGKGEVQGK